MAALGEASGLSGQTAVVLGASSPCGAATARALAREGMNLVLGGRSRDRLEALEEEARASGAEALVVGTHLAKRHHPAHLVEAAVETFGGLDVLLFMAYASAPPSLESLDLDAWERSLDVNLKGFLYCLAPALPVMREGGRGHVVVLGVEDPQGAPDPLSRASRAAVGVVLEQLTRELSSEGVRAAEVRADARRLEGRGVEECAQTVVNVLKEPANPSAESRLYRV